MQTRRTQYQALSLFSGGLDSILATKVIQSQNIPVLGIHFVSPFFGDPDAVKRWEKLYGVPIAIHDVGEDFVRMLLAGPTQGFGKVLNPCIDCKILMFTKARELLAHYGASFIISGTVVGQRPMSQRRDAINIVDRDAGVRDLVLSPLSALRLKPTPMEEQGLVDRSKLLGLWGRGRKAQLRMAREMGITEIPTPAGGCRLTDAEAAVRYVPVFRNHPSPAAADFHLANVGRQYWKQGLWLTIGRDQRDNKRLEGLHQDSDYHFRLADFPGPIGIGRPLPKVSWDEDRLREAAALVASFSPKAKQSLRRVDVVIGHGANKQIVSVMPDRGDKQGWAPPQWTEAQEWKQSWIRK
ncbi:tRNA(5-methylaminomethyl-2-thiouridylate) methyltransferase [Desulfoplanes formicivorans]|uniref:Fibronectin-binding protein n=1 Tax=Desulfoplanes formicivorans TaxID=1592317 RepID=A0A194AHW2_9BACT|nr:tRNA(5-methylaminomethyl-2-thiouridylate) methyltransferase [Desulfoplanes formicivorans]GAU08661.1 fibronectin-binding protein [Desulfoplanes formicivorans]